MSTKLFVGSLAYNVVLIEDERFKDHTFEQITKLFAKATQWRFLFVADTVTLASSEFPIVTIDLSEEPGRSFRVIANELWSVENNLSLANMDYNDFAEAADENGIFRGFRD